MAENVETSKVETPETGETPTTPEETTTIPEETTDTPEEAEGTEVESQSAEELMEEVKKWKALSRKNEERAQENKKLLEDYSSSEEKFKEEREAFEAERAFFEDERSGFLKVRALTQAGLSAELSVLLSGKTQEDITAQVELLRSTLPQAKEEVQEEPVQRTVSPGVPFFPAQNSEVKDSSLRGYFASEIKNRNHSE